MPFAAKVEFNITTHARWDGVGIYQNGECVMTQDFTVSKHVANGDTLIVDLSDIYGVVAASANANRLRGLTVKLHSYEPETFNIPELPEINVLGEYEPIDLCYKRQKTDWLAEGF